MATVKNKQMLLLSVFLVLFLVPMFLYTIKTSSKTLLTNEFYQQHTIESNITGIKSSIIHKYKEPIIFSESKYLNQTRNRSESVICYLVASYTGEVRFAFNPYPRLREKILQLDERFNDNYTTDVIVFHTGYPFREDFLPIIETSRRHIEFVNVDHIFYKFSPGFQPHIKDPNWTMKGKWNYQHMCYFWFKQVFELKIIQQYRYMMRLDDDSQIQGKWPNVFNLMIQHQAVYLANQREADYDYVLPGMARVRNLTVAHIMKNNITVRNLDMFADIFNKTMEIPNYWNNIEVVDLSFIRRKDVLDFTKAVDESQGIFLYRWGDAPLRYITLALFTNATQVLHRGKLGLGYCHPC